MDSLVYNGFYGIAEFNVEKNVFDIRILAGQSAPNMPVVSTDEATQVAPLFQELVEQYCEDCRERNVDPQKNLGFNGSFNVRVGPELHEKCVKTSAYLGMSLNKFVNEAIKDAMARLAHY